MNNTANNNSINNNNNKNNNKMSSLDDDDNDNNNNNKMSSSFDNDNNNNNTNNNNQIDKKNAIEKKFIQLLFTLLENKEDNLNFAKVLSEPNIFYNIFCKDCINIFAQVVTLKINNEKKKKIHQNMFLDDADIKDEVKNYLNRSLLGIMERIEEENVDNLVLDNLQQSPLSTMPLQMCRDLALIMKNDDILKLSNLSGHILRKGLLRGAIFELENNVDDDNFKYSTSVPYTFNKALIKSIPDDIYCTCSNNDYVDKKLCKHFYAKDWESQSSLVTNNGNDDDDDDDNDDDEDVTSSLETNNDATIVTTQDKVNKENETDSNNNTKEDVIIDYKYNIDENGVTKTRNVHDKYLCLKICKHDDDCVLGINNKKIIERNIIITTTTNTTPTPINVVNNDDNNNDNDNNTQKENQIQIQNKHGDIGNMIFVLGSTVFRREKKSTSLYENINFEKYNQLLMTLNKNDKIKKSNLDTFLKFANRYPVEKSASIAVITCVCPITTKMFSDSSILEDKQGYNRKTNTFYLGSVDRNETYSISRKWLEDYIVSNINMNIMNIDIDNDDDDNNDDDDDGNNVDTNFNNNQSTCSMIITPPLCGGKDYYSKLKKIVNNNNNNNNNNGKISLLDNIERLDKIKEIFNASMEDYKQLHKFLNQKSENVPKNIEEDIGKKYLLCMFSKILIEQSLRQLNEIGKIRYN
uniref:SWIM-type domain-containing protein n=1 Tax=Metapenaeus ensis majanivirus TaxID=2984279 RepID=A0A9C7CDN8_9VIRU|nr:MAG: hypothetical protein [Metapenaeus ensis majanivirus]